MYCRRIDYLTLGFHMAYPCCQSSDLGKKLQAAMSCRILTGNLRQAIPISPSLHWTVEIPLGYADP